jgi:hypothetical protein
MRSAQLLLRPVVRAAALLSISVALGSLPVPAAAQPYNPYADSQDSLPPVAADGTLHWGAFYKSAAIQKSYERLWSLGACRGTNKAITVPVERNKMVIDNLPEESFTGRVRATTGTMAGGMIAFTEGPRVDPAAAVLIAQLHPAGVTHVQVGGRTSAGAIKPGMSVRLRATVDGRGKTVEPVRTVDIVTPPADFKPDPIRANTPDTIVGTVIQNRGKMLLLKVDAGSIRRLSLPLADDAAVMIVDAAQLDLIAPGDEVEITGRRWSGEGSQGAGTVFSSRIVVNKATTLPNLSAQPGADEVGLKKPL